MNTTTAGYRLIDEKSPTKKIEQIARICYKSEDKICEGSDFKMIKNLVERQHLAMLEHADVCVQVSDNVYYFMNTMCKKIMETVRDDKKAERCYLRFTNYAVISGSIEEPQRWIISGNMRAWIETFTELEKMKALIPELCDAVTAAVGGTKGPLYQFIGHGGVDPCYDYMYSKYSVSINVVTDYSQLSYEERMIHETFTVLFTCDRGVTHELVRMRESSFAQESTRYCNYSLGKHGNQVSVIHPIFFEEGTEAYKEWQEAMEDAERHYLRLTQDLHIPAQQARTVLPHSTKVDIAMTANLREWRHIFELRACDSTGPCHPQMTEVMRPCFRDMREKYRFAFGDLYAPDEVTS